MPLGMTGPLCEADTSQGHGDVFQVWPTGGEQEFPNLIFHSAGVRFCRFKVENASTGAEKTRRLNEFIALELARDLEVDSVFTAFRNNVFYAWVVIDPFTLQARERIYGREQTIIDEFPMFEFDFYIIAKSGRGTDEIVSESIEKVYQR